MSDQFAKNFLKGGEAKVIELEYENLKINDEVLKNIQNNLDEVQYFLRFKNNLGEEWLEKVNSLKLKKEVYR